MCAKAYYNSLQLKMADISLKKCVKECAVRPMCNAVNYHRSYPYCELLSQDFGNVSYHNPPCVLIKKSDIVANLPMKCQQCEDGETCEIDNMTGNGTCVIKECKPLNLSNVLGNMHVIGSRILHYTLFFRQPNGNTPFFPVCIPSLGYCPGLILQDGLTYTGEDAAAISNGCATQASQCKVNGAWEPYPICSYPVIARYLGCFRDCPDRLLDKAIYTPYFSPVTVDSCIQICTSKGYNFAYLQNANECYCGKEVVHFTQVPESDCDFPCADNSNQRCGGGWRASLYDMTITTGNRGIINNVTRCDPYGECVPACTSSGPQQIYT